MLTKLGSDLILDLDEVSHIQKIWHPSASIQITLKNGTTLYSKASIDDLGI
jgi:hypothetical protein